MVEVNTSLFSKDAHMDIAYLPHLYYAGVALFFVLSIYFAVGLFTWCLEMEATLFQVISALHVEEIIFWPFHADTKESWSRRWRSGPGMRKKITTFLSLLAVFAILYVYLVVILENEGQAFIISTWFPHLQ